MEFNTSILKSLVVFAILPTLISAIYSRIAPLFALNNIFFPVNEIAFTKRNDQSDFMACLRNQSNCTKRDNIYWIIYKPAQYWINKIFVQTEKRVSERINFAI